MSAITVTRLPGKGLKPVLLVIDQITNPHAGTESQLLKLIAHLPDYGYQPELLVLRHTPALTSCSVPCPVHVAGIGSMRHVGSWLRLMGMAWALRRAGHHLVHCFFNDASLMIPPLFRPLGFRCLISRRDLGYWYTPGYKAALRVSRFFVARAVANSEAVREVTHRNERIPLEQIAVIYNGYEHQSAPDQNWQPPAVLRALYERGEFVVALVANIRSIKRIDDAIRAVALAGNQGALVHLAVLGDGHSDQLIALAARLGIADQVHFLGKRTDVDQCLKWVGAGVLCSDSEGFSNAIVEYMFAGLPVIGTRVGGNPEAVTEDRHGFLFNRGDLVRFSELLVRLAMDPQTRKALGRNARASAGQRFSINTMMIAHTRLYDEFCHRVSRRTVR